MDKVIFWDFDGTLVYPNTRFVDALDLSLKKFGYHIDRDALTAYLKSAYPWLNYEISYQNQTDKWWDTLLEKLRPLYDDNKIACTDKDKINASFKDTIVNVYDYVLYPDTQRVLDKCIELGYKNYILSNNYPELDKQVEACNLTKYFSDIIVSSKVGFEKPRKELFDYAKKVANCTDGIMVGDNPIADVLGAKQNGLKTVLVHNKCESVADYYFDCLEEILSIL